MVAGANETGSYRIWMIDSRATNINIQNGSPQAKVLLDNLPGYPDNLMRGRNGRIWVGLFKPRNPAADSLAGKPFLVVASPAQFVKSLYHAK